MAYSIKKPKFKPVTVTRRDFRNFDVDGFVAAAETAPWENIILVQNVNDKVTVLENTINDLLDVFAPYKTFTIRKPNSTPWLTDEILDIMNKRDMFKMNYNKTRNKTFLANYKELRNKVTSMMRQSQKKLFNETINDKVKNPKKFYAAAKKLNVVSDKSTRSSINFTAESLNETFLKNNNANIDANFIQEKISDLHSKTLPSIHKFYLTDITEHDVIKVARTIKSMSVGVDNINSFVIKLLINRISTVLTNIINTSFQTGIFPDRWKSAVIKPIPKLPIPLAASDFRPISLLPALSKIIEKLVNIQIVAYLTKHSLLDPYQSAYRKNHSAQTALLKLTEDIFDTIDDSEVTLLVFLDFSKAFDTVNHKLLLAKLAILGFQENVCDWILSYLSGRQQMVKTDKDKSKWSSVLNGVPQGSILGPLLFTILVSDMRVTIWNGSYITYADDTNLYWESTVEAINDTIKKANGVLQNISTYCDNTILKLNEDKCKFMVIGSKPAIRKIKTMHLDKVILNNISLDRVEHTKLLGVTFDEVLSWRKHVNLCISKAMANFLQMYRFKRFLDTSSKKILCESIVLSQFNYCSVVYCSIDVFLERKIQKIQNMCTRFIYDYRRKDDCNYVTCRKEMGWLNMKNRTLKFGLIQIYKILNGLAPNYLRDSFTLVSEIHKVNTRRSSNINIFIDKNISSKIHRKAYTFYIAKIYNSLPEKIKKSDSVNSFKKTLHRYIVENDLVLPSS